MSTNLTEAREATSHDPVSKQLFRQVMGRFATGVTVVTTTGENQIYGMTANAFMAGSLEPMLCVVSVNRTAHMHERLLRAGHFGVSFLSEWQQHLSAHFAGQRQGAMGPEFAYRGLTPILARAVAAVTADVVDTTECGDHTLFVGEINHLETAVGRPLLFYRGRYARIDLFNSVEEASPPEFW
jgi:flavin reductase (DIM6/NTAB) family NADH-FMN oxidoreductase RutF